MSGTFPTTPAPSSMSLRSIQPTLISVAHSLKRQVRSRGGQRWGFALGFQNRTRDEMAPLLAFALAQVGQYETFTYTPPVIGTPRGVATGTPLVVGAHTTGRSVATDGWTPSITVMKAGDFLKFANHAKVYMLTADAVSSGGGAATLAIEPELVSDLADNEAMTITAVPFTVAFASDAHEVSVMAKPVFDWSCELVEAP
jgi:hypothetical protein